MELSRELQEELNLLSFPDHFPYEFRERLVRLWRALENSDQAAFKATVDEPHTNIFGGSNTIGHVFYKAYQEFIDISKDYTDEEWWNLEDIRDSHDPLLTDLLAKAFPYWNYRYSKQKWVAEIFRDAWVPLDQWVAYWKEMDQQHLSNDEMEPDSELVTHMILETMSEPSHEKMLELKRIIDAYRAADFTKILEFLSKLTRKHPANFEDERIVFVTGIIRWNSKLMNERRDIVRQIRLEKNDSIATKAILDKVRLFLVDVFQYLLKDWTDYLNEGQKKSLAEMRESLSSTV